MKNHAGYCYIWNESEGGTNAEEFTTNLSRFILEKIIPSLGSEKPFKIIFYSDGCTAQNRNVTMANALLNVANITKITIEQKFLEVGHTQMEADAMHSTIERKIKNKIINVPAEYINICKNDVNYITYSFF